MFCEKAVVHMMRVNNHNIRETIISVGDPEKALHSQRFFKTQKGEYGYGDTFLGLTVPAVRQLVKKHWQNLSNEQVLKLLKDQYHEIRLFALLVWVQQFDAGTAKVRSAIFQEYIHNTKYINNWDLVDLSADRIVGEYLFGSDDSLLDDWAISSSIWERRMAILATFANIKHGDAERTFSIAVRLLSDKHDLIHKAVGWMLREAGKRVSLQKEEEFLQKHYATMPRTMLRYAIERFDEQKRLRYLHGEI